MTMMASQITSLTIVYSSFYSGADQRKHQSSVSLAFVREIHRGPVKSPHKWPVTRKLFPFDDVIMTNIIGTYLYANVVVQVTKSDLNRKFNMAATIMTWLSRGIPLIDICMGI